jgi:DNA-nicking Smr family endonuclease
MPTEEDKTIFRQAVQGVRPLHPRHLTRASLVNKKTHRRPIRQIFEVENTVKIFEQNYAEVAADEQLLFFQPSLQPKNLKKLRQGKMEIDAILDLHSMTIAEAKGALEKFLTRCQNQDLRSVLIIHGKGLAKIKSAVNTWLREYALTLAFSSAVPKDGGAGAVYLLLKKS